MEPSPTKPAEGSKTGLVYDVAMTRHQNEVNPYHPETPERISETWHALEVKGYLERCTLLESREATDEDIVRIHSEEHLATIASTPDLSEEKRVLLSRCYNSIFINAFTFAAARLAAGCVIELTEAVVTGRVRNGVALVRPPGHHAECTHSMGFCHFNNVAIATKYALDSLGLQRVLIVDWDIHHGNATQHQFYDDKRVLYFSLHRYDGGMFFPGADDANYDRVGSGEGTGFNINVAWNGRAKGDVDYLLAFYHILMPVALEFEPELVIVSCGFDAGMGDPLGGYQVTPAGYAHMTHLLMGMAQGKVVVALEGGYSLFCIRESTCAILSVLLGDAPLPELSKEAPSESSLESLRHTISAHAKYWASLNVWEGAVPGADEAACPGETVESRGRAGSYGRERASEDLSEVREMLLNESSSAEQKLSHDSLPEPPQEHGDQAPVLHDHPSVSPNHLSAGSSDVAAEGSHDQPPGAGGEAAAVRVNTTMQDMMLALEQQGHDTMFAVTPKPWCEHLASHVKPLPSAGIDATKVCETCGSAQEPWICLTCYHVFCGRYVNQHMVVHQDTAGHKMTLSFSDLSVWCYLCDSYIDNHVLMPAINSAHLSKYGTNVDGSH